MGFCEKHFLSFSQIFFHKKEEIVKSYKKHFSDLVFWSILLFSFWAKVVFNSNPVFSWVWEKNETQNLGLCHFINLLPYSCWYKYHIVLEWQRDISCRFCLWLKGFCLISTQVLPGRKSERLREKETQNLSQCHFYKSFCPIVAGINTILYWNGNAIFRVDFVCGWRVL